jgi:hypothetical protein
MVLSSNHPLFCCHWHAHNQIVSSAWHAISKPLRVAGHTQNQSEGHAWGAVPAPISINLLLLQAQDQQYPTTP